MTVGHSRVSATERPEGCIAKAVALTPWLGGREAREGLNLCVSGRDRMDSWANTHHGTPFSKTDGHWGRHRQSQDGTPSQVRYKCWPGVLHTSHSSATCPGPLALGPPPQSPAPHRLSLTYSHRHAHTHTCTHAPTGAHMHAHAQSSHYSLSLGRKQLSAVKLLLVFLLLCLPGC